MLAALDIPADEPEPGWFLRVLTSPPPDGVRAEPTDAGRTTTLCTFVADLTGNQATIVTRDAEPVTVPLTSLTTLSQPAPPTPIPASSKRPLADLRALDERMLMR